MAGDTSKPSTRQSEDRALRFRRNFLRLLERKSVSIKQLSERTGVSLQTLRYWKRFGIAYSRDERLEIVARFLGVSDPQSLFEVDLETRSSPPPVLDLRETTKRIDRETNPMIAEVLSDHPELFRGFDENDWDELYSLHGTGGALTYEGVQKSAELINRKRELRRKFDALLETDHFETLAHLIDVLYRDSTL